MPQDLPGFGRLDIHGECVVELQLAMEITATQGRTVWNGPQLHPDDRSGHGGDERVRSHGEDAAHAHAHSGDADRVGLGAGWTTVVPDLPFCAVNRGPLLFALYARHSHVIRALCCVLDVAQVGAVLGTIGHWRLALCTESRRASQL